MWEEERRRNGERESVKKGTYGGKGKRGGGNSTHVKPLISVNSCLIVPPCCLADSLALYMRLCTRQPSLFLSLKISYRGVTGIICW